MRSFTIAILSGMCGLCLALTGIEGQDQAEAAKQAQMSAALKIISEQCLTGEGVTESERAEACKLVNEVPK